MRKLLFPALAAVLALAGCQNSDKTAPDVRTLELTGDVKEVYRSEVAISNSMDEEQGDPLLEDDELFVSFDEQGRVTRDPYGNEFAYDEDGDFTGTYAEWTEVERDAQGRLIAFDNTEIPEERFDDFDVTGYCKLNFTYDAQGRVVKEEYTGWEWGSTTQRSYEGSKFYPSQAVEEFYDAGSNEKTTYTYDYLEFDARGNWTEREVTAVTEAWEEGSEDDVERYTIVTREVRTINYWSSK